MLIQILPFSPLFFYRSQFFVRSFLQVLSSLRSSNCYSHSLNWPFLLPFLSLSRSMSFSLFSSPFLCSPPPFSLSFKVRSGGWAKKDSKTAKEFFLLVIWFTKVAVMWALEMRKRDRKWEGTKHDMNNRHVLYMAWHAHFIVFSIGVSPSFLFLWANTHKKKRWARRNQFSFFPPLACSSLVHDSLMGQPRLFTKLKRRYGVAKSLLHFFLLVPV